MVSKMLSGYLFALGLTMFVIGFVLANPGSGYYERIRETAKEPMVVIVFVVAVYVQSTRRRAEDVTLPAFAKDGSVSFLTPELAADTIERVTVRPSMFRDLVSIKVKLKNGNVIARTCPAKSAECLLDSAAPYKVDSRKFPFYLMYTAFLFGMFVCGVLWAFG